MSIAFATKPRIWKMDETSTGTPLFAIDMLFTQNVLLVKHVLSQIEYNLHTGEMMKHEYFFSSLVRCTRVNVDYSAEKSNTIGSFHRERRTSSRVEIKLSNPNRKPSS